MPAKSALPTHNPSSLANKRILLGVSGGIAAYKACELARQYQQAGAQVRVIMTRAATQFISPLTMQALSGEEVHTELVDYKQEAAMGHIALARWADALVVAPASASLLARLASGDATDLLAAVFLATAAPRLLAPAMNRQMWEQKITQSNIKLLAKQAGTLIIPPGEGWQACGEVGPGRLAEPAEIVARAATLFQTGVLAGKKVIVTAGATREPLDAARFISNYSSGKMGYALARAAVEAGATTTLITAPVHLPIPVGCRSVIKVETARQMLDACLTEAKDCAIFIAAAAVADLRPRQSHDDKPPKETYARQIAVEPTEDILAALSAHPRHRPNLLIGFAAQSAAGKQLTQQGERKLRAKKVDLLCVNQIPQAFDDDENEIVLLRPGARSIKLKRARKESLARRIIKEIALLWQKRSV